MHRAATLVWLVARGSWLVARRCDIQDDLGTKGEAGILKSKQTRRCSGGPDPQESVRLHTSPLARPRLGAGLCVRSSLWDSGDGSRARVGAVPVPLVPRGAEAMAFTKSGIATAASSSNRLRRDFRRLIRSRLPEVGTEHRPRENAGHRPPGVLPTSVVFPSSGPERGLRREHIWRWLAGRQRRDIASLTFRSEHRARRRGWAAG